MMKNKYMVISVLTFIIIVMTILSIVHFSKPALELVSEQGGGIHDFYVKDEKVYILGGVTIQNNGNIPLSYELVVTSQIDYRAGLVKSPVLEVYDETMHTKIFHLGPHESKTFSIVAVGDYAGTYQKHNRLMPLITILY